MKKLAIALLSMTLVSTSACADNDNNADNNANSTLEGSAVIATYSQGSVTEKEVMNKFEAILSSQEETKGKSFSELDSNRQKALVINYIMYKLFEKEAEKENILKSKKFEDQMMIAKSQIIQNELLEIHTKDAASDANIKAEYKKLSDQFKNEKERKISHILVDTEEAAKKLKEQLVKGADFKTLAQKFSKDENSAAQGGEIGYINKNISIAEIATAAFALKKDEISDPVKTNLGWHIIKLHDIRDIKIPELKDIEDQIRNKLLQEAARKYLVKIEEEANIELKL